MIQQIKIVPQLSTIFVLSDNNGREEITYADLENSMQVMATQNEVAIDSLHYDESTFEYNGRVYPCCSISVFGTGEAVLINNNTGLEGFVGVYTVSTILYLYRTDATVVHNIFKRGNAIYWDYPGIVFASVQIVTYLDGVVQETFPASSSSGQVDATLPYDRIDINVV